MCKHEYGQALKSIEYVPIDTRVVQGSRIVLDEEVTKEPT